MERLMRNLHTYQGWDERAETMKKREKWLQLSLRRRASAPRHDNVSARTGGRTGGRNDRGDSPTNEWREGRYRVGAKPRLNRDLCGQNLGVMVL